MNISASCFICIIFIF